MSGFDVLPLRGNLSLLPRSPATLTLAALIVAVVTATSTRAVSWESLAFRGDVATTEWWRSFTYILVHAGWVHAALNLLLLYLYGPQLERILGSPTAGAIAVGGGACGVVLLLAVWPIEGNTRGASEAALAIVGALVAVHLVRTGWSGDSVRALAVAGALLLAAGLLTVGGVGTVADPGWQGILFGMYVHVGGLVPGLVLGLVAARSPSPWRPVAVVAVAAIALVLLTAVGAHRWSDKYAPPAEPNGSHAPPPG
jgi:membrane associated rhomboid family serine protease